MKMENNKMDIYEDGEERGRESLMWSGYREGDIDGEKVMEVYRERECVETGCTRGVAK